jgi:hypothetical protein
LKDVGIADLCTEIETHAVTGTVHSGTATEYTMVTFRSVIASMIKLAYGEAYDEDLVVANATDIQVYDEFDTAWISPLDAYLPVNYFTSTPGPNFVYLTMCSNAYEVLKHICNQFALIPRYTFGTTAEIISGTPANNKSRLTFDSRGRTGVLVTMPSKFVESDLLMDTPRKGRNIRVYETFTPDNGYYFYNNQEHSGQPPSYMEFDITKTVDHELHNGGLFAYGYLYTFDSGASEWYHLETGRYWDYSTGAYVEVDQATDYGFAGALAGYMFNRFSDGRFGYTRNYAGLKATYSATDSQRWLRSLCRHALHDGVTNRTFYATEVSKDIKENKASVVWLEE